MSSRSLVTFSLACGFTALVAAISPTQPPRQDPQRPPTFRTEANFVRVDVFVTTGGVPVRDLAIEDFDVLEDGLPQKLSTFEYVQVKSGTAQELRDEPNTIQQSRDALKNPRARVFVLFLDTPHVTIDGTWHAREAISRMVDRVMGAEDLVGVMTPYMSPADIVFARKTAVLTGGLLNRWPWGERHTMVMSEKDQLYASCYPWPTREMQDVVREMILRRKERATLDAFAELVGWLREQREERKAVITVSEGWLLYKPNSDLTRPRVINPATGEREPTPGPDPIGTGPGGKITFGSPLIDANGRLGGRKTECDNERLHLSAMDNFRYLQDIMEIANRANASFYTVDPRGLAVFDYPIDVPNPGSDARGSYPPGVITDSLHLRTRLDSLRILADNTDGLAVIGNNNLEPGLRRISDDLSSYYLLGYYSSNARLDGKFRKLSVKVKRPGVDIRARRGYRAPSTAEVAEARPGSASPVPESMRAATAALEALARLRPEARLYTHAVAIGRDDVTVWFSGELAKPVASATAASVNISAGGAAATTEIPLLTGQRSFTGSMSVKQVGSAPIEVRVRVSPPGEIPFTDALRVDVATDLPSPMMFRRGPSTGNRYEPAAQPQFSRTDRARFDLPRVAGLALTDVRVLDRNGNAIDVLVTRSEREGWLSAELTLAPLAAGDYIVELSGSTGGGPQKVLEAFRVSR